MKRWKSLTAAALAAASVFGSGLAHAQQGGAEAPEAAAAVKPLSDAELNEVLDIIRNVAAGDPHQSYVDGLNQVAQYVRNSFLRGMVQTSKLTQEAADKIGAEVDRAVETLTKNAKLDGNRYEAQAQGMQDLVAAVRTSVNAMSEDGSISKEAAAELVTNVDRLTGRASAGMLVQQAVRGVTSKHLNVYGLANNRAVSDEQVEIIVDALEELKSQLPDAGDAIDSQIFKVENLTIGREAPNIQGVDTDEVEFELKDYDGKVVVLDFWGDW